VQDAASTTNATHSTRDQARIADISPNWCRIWKERLSIIRRQPRLPRERL
jgi:hypothetical protein